MGRETIRIGTRGSPLALKQVEEIVSSLSKFHPHLNFRVIKIETAGDKDKNTPLEKLEGTDFFTREIEDALIRGEIDLAVHSAKDLPNRIPEKLMIAVITESIDSDDVLVSKKDLSLNELPRGARIGTSSLRRKTQLENYRKDFRIVDIRGNIEKRLKTLDKTDLDAIMIAAAGLIRLGLENRIAQRIPFDILKPHPLQGKLAIEVRKDNEDIIRLCRECLSQSDG